MNRRLFLAVLPEDDVRHRIVTALEGVSVPGRLVPPQEWHVTLRFLGDVDEVATDQLVHSLEEAPLGSDFTIRWGGLGAFPRPAKATVLWVGVEEGGGHLEQLAHRVEDAVTGAGLPAEERPFRAHLTVSRIRPPRDVSDLLELPKLGARTRVSAVCLMESDPTRPRGERYRVVETFSLD